MKAITKFLAGGVAIAAIAGAAPAAAQYFPGYGSPYGYGMPGVGGYGYSPYGPAVNTQAAVSQCANAVQARLSGGGYGGYGYNAYSQYGYGGGRVLGISRVEQGLAGNVTVRGVATSGRTAAYGYGQSPVDLTWRCKTDPRGFVFDVDINLAQPNYGTYGYTPPAYTPYNPYSQYGYVRY
ncbi:MAG: hypothetical protein ACM3ZV_04570 [Bacillota bacterium]